MDEGGFGADAGDGGFEGWVSGGLVGRGGGWSLHMMTTVLLVLSMGLAGIAEAVGGWLGMMG